LRCWLKSTIEGVEVLLDYLQREILIALRKKYIAKTIEICRCKFSIARWGSLRFDESFRFQETNL
jgi:hypothetical protein